MEEDTDEPIEWSQVNSLASIFADTKMSSDGGLLDVPWESLLGRIIRKNKMAFRVIEKPADGIIVTDMASVGSVLSGIIDSGLNSQLTAEGILHRVLKSSVYPQGENTDNDFGP